MTCGDMPLTDGADGVGTLLSAMLIVVEPTGHTLNHASR